MGSRVSLTTGRGREFKDPVQWEANTAKGSLTTGRGREFKGTVRRGVSTVQWVRRLQSTTRSRSQVQGDSTAGSRYCSVGSKASVDDP